MDRMEEPFVTAKTKQVQKNRLLGNQPLYQSPVMYQNLKKGNLNFSFDPHKEDVFALGLVMAEAGTGNSIQNIYDAKTGNVNEAALNQHIQNFNNQYNQTAPTMCNVVAHMLETDETKRYNAKDIIGSINPYEQVKQYMVEHP